MPRKYLISGATIGILAFLLLSFVVAAMPAQQSAMTSDQALFATLDFKNTQDAANRALDADQSTQIAQLWLTVDSQQIATLVATLTSTQAPTSTRTNTPGILASPTQEVLTTPFTATPTFQSATNSPTPTRSPTPALLITPTELPPMVYGHNVSGLVRNVRECPDLDCEIVATVPIDGIVVLDISQVIEADNYRWVRTWNEQGWVSVERLSPFARYIIWD